MELEKLLSLPESKTLEYKKDISSLNSILKTIVAFANTAGGILIIGKATDGTLHGIADVFKAEEALANSIADSIRPNLFPEIEIATIHGKNIIIVHVSYWKAPFYIKKEGIPRGVYIRLGSASRPVDSTFLAEIQRTTLNTTFDQQMLTELFKEDIHLDMIYKMFKEVEKEINDQKLLSLGVFGSFMNRIVPTIGGLILFGKKEVRQRILPDARVRCARFLGNDKTTILDSYDIEGTIIEAVDEVQKFIARNTRRAFQIKTIRRKDIPEYPPIAIREAVINALAHADYSIGGSQIHIAIFDNRLEIQNPGMLPFGFTLQDLRAGASRVRNRIVVRVFHELELMEKWGSGYKRIIVSCQLGGYQEPKWEEFATYIRVTFFPHLQTQLKDDIGPTSDLSERERHILQLFEKEKNLSFSEIHKKISISISERMLRYDLVQLKTKGFLKQNGKGRVTTWQLIQQI